MFARLLFNWNCLAIPSIFPVLDFLIFNSISMNLIFYNINLLDIFPMNMYWHHRVTNAGNCTTAQKPNDTCLFKNPQKMRNSCFTLTHLFPMHPFSTPWKHQKTVRFSYVFRGNKKGCIGNKWFNVNPFRANAPIHYNTAKYYAAIALAKHCNGKIGKEWVKRVQHLNIFCLRLLTKYNYYLCFVWRVCGRVGRVDSWW